MSGKPARKNFSVDTWSTYTNGSHNHRIYLLLFSEKKKLCLLVIMYLTYGVTERAYELFWRDPRQVTLTQGTLILQVISEYSGTPTVA